MRHDGGEGWRWPLAALALLLGAALAYGLWRGMTGGNVPLQDDLPPARYTLALSLALGAAAGAGVYYALRALLRRRGA